jgi:YceI-like domain
MTLTRYILDDVRSCITVSGRSSLHPIDSEAHGITGWFESDVRSDGSLDLSVPAAGHLELTVDRLTSGNRLYDRELRRRIQAAVFPTINGRLRRITATDRPRIYMVSGEISFHGSTRTFEHELRIEVAEHGVEMTGEYVFDIRQFGMEPPSLLMIRVYPEIRVRINLYGVLHD